MTRSRKYTFGAALLLLLITIFLALHDGEKESIFGTWDRVAVSISPISIPTPTVIIQENLQDVNEATYPVVKVVDGDTIVVALGGINQTVRLIGINTPESVDPRKPVECFGNEASDKAKSILMGRSVRLVVDPTQGERDKYNRILRYVFRDDGLFFNKQMILEGYAYEYTYSTPYQYQAEFKEAQGNAQQSKVGLWSPDTACGVKVVNEVVDRDCSDFTSQQEAQNFFISAGGPNKDPHKLDSNGDGTVCESLP